MNQIEPNTIRPKQNGKADFFSWQLYRYVKKNPHACQIWKGTWNNVTGIDRENPVLYIGYMDESQSGSKWLHGSMLRSVCRARGDRTGYAYGPEFDTHNWEEITDQWWQEYMRIGVCAIHGDNAHNWNEQGKTRTCEYCGKVEKKAVYMVPKTVWEAA